MSIEERAMAYAKSNQGHILHGGDIYMAYIAGAREAEWRMCEDELPDMPCECVCHDGERMFFAEWVDETPNGGLRGWSINGLTNQPIAWFPLPKFTPKA